MDRTLSRRQVVMLGGTVTASLASGRLLSGQVGGAVSDASSAVSVESLHAQQSIKAPDPDETTSVVVKVGNDASTMQTVDVSLLAKTGESVRSRRSTRITLGRNAAEPAFFAVEGPAMSTDSDIDWNLSARVTDAASDDVLADTGTAATVVYNSEYTGIDERTDHQYQLREMGAALGEWGVANRVPGSRSLMYFAGWLISEVNADASVAVDVQRAMESEEAVSLVADLQRAVLSVVGASIPGLVIPPVSSSSGDTLSVDPLLGVTLQTDTQSLAKVLGKFLTAYPDLAKPVVSWLQRVYSKEEVDDASSKAMDGLPTEPDPGLGTQEGGAEAASENEAVFTVEDLSHVGDTPYFEVNGPISLPKSVYAEAEGEQGHIKPWSPWDPDAETIEETIREADHAWTQATRDGDPLLVLVRDLSGESYDVVKAYYDGSRWLVSDAWSEVTASFLVNRLHRIGFKSEVNDLPDLIGDLPISEVEQMAKEATDVVETLVEVLTESLI